MRREFSRIVEEIIQSNENTVFITGDLGYAALENIQAAAKKRFINAGVAEQNMIGVAAGIAYKGFEVFTYSIAPFIVYRCLEQIRLDVCIHKKPVYLVGNGGGYGYGIMGATHHALEDIACMSAMPNMTCWVPAFKEDVAYCLTQITDRKSPAYLRLGLAKVYPSPIEISPINKVHVSTNDSKLVVVVLGPVVHNVLDAIKAMDNVEVFTILTVPIIELSEELTTSIDKTKRLLVVEEHVERGGLAEHLFLKVNKEIRGVQCDNLCAKGYPDGLYGDQAFHQKQSGLNAESIRNKIAEMIEKK